MKWRHSLIYLLILLLAGGYYYYFEVVRKGQKEAAEKEGKKVFHLNKDSLDSLEISSRDKKPVQLKKEDAGWMIHEPLRTEVDKGALDSLLGALADMELQREIVPSTEDLKPFGLAEPFLKIRFQTGDQWRELFLGDLNPAGGAYYAKTSERAGVFLIAVRDQSVLNKGLDELRRRELFSFKPDDVTAMRIAWQDGTVVTVRKQEGEAGWKAVDLPELKIKNSKVSNVVEQVQWLRAKTFLDDKAEKLESHGLDSPLVSVTLQLKTTGKPVELRLAKTDKEKNQIAALSSELPAVVEIAGEIMNDLPRDMQLLEDRSLITVSSEDVREIKWRVGESEGHVAQSGENKWERKKEGAGAEQLEDSWRVKSLLWDLNSVEYVKKLGSTTPAVPEKPYGRLELLKDGKTLSVLTWEKAPEKTSPDPPFMWLSGEGSTEAVQVGVETLEKIEQGLAQLILPAGQGNDVP